MIDVDLSDKKGKTWNTLNLIQYFRSENEEKIIAHQLWSSGGTEN